MVGGVPGTDAPVLQRARVGCVPHLSIDTMVQNTRHKTKARLFGSSFLFNLLVPSLSWQMILVFLPYQNHTVS
jgi:hypothetical protein